MVQAPPVRPPDLAEQRPLEDRIFEVALSSPIAGRKSILTIFRSSDVDFRLVIATSWTDEQNQLLVERESFLLNMTTTRFIPAYAVPNAGPKSPTVNNILLYQTQDDHPFWQYLKCPDDVFLFQQALIGYHVCHEMVDVRWCFNGSEKPEKSGKCKLQFWQVKRLLPKVAHTGETESFRRSLHPVRSTISSITSPMSPAESSLRHQMGPASPTVSPTSPRSTPEFSNQSTHHSTATRLSSSSSITSRVTGSRGDGTAIVPPDPPVLILYTMHEERYTIQHLERTLKSRPSFLSVHAYHYAVHTIHVDPQQCKCRRSPKSCRRVVLQANEKTINVRRLSAREKNEQGLHSWDIAPFRLPRHPKYRNLEVVPKVKYICLDFPTVEGKL